MVFYQYFLHFSLKNNIFLVLQVAGCKQQVANFSFCREFQIAPVQIVVVTLHVGGPQPLLPYFFELQALVISLCPKIPSSAGGQICGRGA